MSCSGMVQTCGRVNRLWGPVPRGVQIATVARWRRGRLAGHLAAGVAPKRGVDPGLEATHHPQMEPAQSPTGPTGPAGPHEPSSALSPLVQQHLAQELLHRMRELHAQLEFLRLLLRLQRLSR